MVRTTFLIAIAFATYSPFASVHAQAKPKDESSKHEKPVVTLHVGDPAPALTVTEWLQGEPVKKFEPGKVYVVEFWAAWCGACIRAMPHLAELQARYKDRGVTVICFTSRNIRGSDNSDEKVAAFVKRRGPSLPLEHFQFPCIA